MNNLVTKQFSQLERDKGQRWPWSSVDKIWTSVKTVGRPDGIVSVDMCTLDVHKRQEQDVGPPFKRVFVANEPTATFGKLHRAT